MRSPLATDLGITFGALEALFEHYGWPERGANMMRKVQTRVVETYGSVKVFEAHFARAI